MQKEVVGKEDYKTFIWYTVVCNQIKTYGLWEADKIIS